MCITTGEPEVLEQLLAKLNAADGVGFLLTDERDFRRREGSSRSSKSLHRLWKYQVVKLHDPEVLNRLPAFMRQDFVDWD
jgi:hypothetical protein